MQCNVTCRWMNASYSLSCSMYSQLWSGEQHEGEEGEKGNLKQTHNATQCHLQMNGCVILTNYHFPCISSCEGGRTGGGGRRNGNLITTTQCNTMSLADEWMHNTHSLSCSMHYQLWRGEQHEWKKEKRQLNNNQTMKCNVTCRWMDASYSLAVMSMHSQLWRGEQHEGWKENTET